MWMGVCDGQSGGEGRRRVPGDWRLAEVLRGEGEGAALAAGSAGR